MGDGVFFFENGFKGSSTFIATTLLHVLRP